VWVSDSATPGGEICRIKSVAATYLETHAALTGDYTVANGAVVYADAEEYNWLNQRIIDATSTAEDTLQQALIDRTYDFYQDYFTNATQLKLPYPPLDSVIGVYTTSTSNVETEFTNAHYWIDTSKKPARIVLNYGETWPTGLRDEKAIRVRYIAGYGAYADVPQWIKSVMLEMIAYWYAEREGGGLSPNSGRVPGMMTTDYEAVVSKLYRDAIAFCT